MEREKLSANEIKIQNRQRIYQFIRENYQVSKQDVVVGLQLSLPTVHPEFGVFKKSWLD